ncbi:MAG: hypothetical protein ACRED1_14685 [Limisphaerales bacterium]
MFGSLDDVRANVAHAAERRAGLETGAFIIIHGGGRTLEGGSAG